MPGMIQTEKNTGTEKRQPFRVVPDSVKPGLWCEVTTGSNRFLHLLEEGKNEAEKRDFVGLKCTRNGLISSMRT